MRHDLLQCFTSDGYSLQSLHASSTHVTVTVYFAARTCGKRARLDANVISRWPTILSIASCFTLVGGRRMMKKGRRLSALILPRESPPPTICTPLGNRR